MSEAVESLVRAWSEWDQKPGNEDRTAAMSAALRAVAIEVGAQPNLLSAAIQALRRDGLRVRAAVEAAVESFASA